MELVDETLVVDEVKVQDIRWPTSKGGHGSDAMVRMRLLSGNIYSKPLKPINSFSTWILTTPAFT